MRYRPDIDGLRAIAVLGVLLYHFGLGSVTGGFSGVDVFFVLSGYLISGIIIREMHQQRFTFAGFYERRIRRIAPALFATLSASAAIAWIVLLPSDLKEFSKTLVASILGASNLRFSRQGGGYFDRSSEANPLLHTWSLGVEEQFYLVFPVLLLILLRFVPRYAGAVLFTIFAASLMASVVDLRTSFNAVFYLPTYRCWELLLGALPHFLGDRAQGRLDRIPGLAPLGIALILISFFGFSTETHFPGLTALAPCMGGLFIILAGERNTSSITRVLASPIPVWIGRASYSLYLWHWPLLVFTRYYLARDLTLWESLGLLLGTFGLGFVSWKWIEGPFRKKGFVESRGVLFLLAGLAATVLIVVAVAGWRMHGAPARFSSETLALDAARTPTKPFQNCFERLPDRVRAGDLCIVGDTTNAKTDYLIWGDSHSLALLPAFNAALAEMGSKAIYAGTGTCPPLLGVETVNRGNWRARWGCVSFNDAVGDLLVKRQDIGTVVLAAAWSRYSDPSFGFDLREGSQDGNVLDFAPVLARSLNFLNGKRILLVDQVPAPGIEVPFVLARARESGITIDSSTLTMHRHVNRRYSEALMSLQAQFGFDRIDLASTYCPEQGACRIVVDGKPLYWDRTHLNALGASLAVPRIRDALLKASASKP